MKKILYYLTLILSLSLFGGSVNTNFDLTDSLSAQGKQKQEEQSDSTDVTMDESSEEQLDEEGTYTDPEQVALYIRTYGKLPTNYITKREAIELGLLANKEKLTNICLGGDVFYNREEVLENEANRVYYECDVNYTGGSRGPERLIYSNDGLIYYSPDHYESFKLIHKDTEILSNNIA